MKDKYVGVDGGLLEVVASPNRHVTRKPSAATCRRTRAAGTICWWGWNC